MQRFRHQEDRKLAFIRSDHPYTGKKNKNRNKTSPLLPLEWSMHEAQQMSRAFHLPSHCAALQMLIERYPRTDVAHV